MVTKFLNVKLYDMFICLFANKFHAINDTVLHVISIFSRFFLRIVAALISLLEFRFANSVNEIFHIHRDALALDSARVLVISIK